MLAILFQEKTTEPPKALCSKRMYVSVYVLLYSYMHLYILFVKVKVMSSVKAQWITHLDSNFLSKIVRLSPQSTIAGMYTCLNHLILHCQWLTICLALR